MLPYTFSSGHYLYRSIKRDRNARKWLKSMWLTWLKITVATMWYSLLSTKRLPLWSNVTTINATKANPVNVSDTALRLPSVLIVYSVNREKNPR